MSNLESAPPEVPCGADAPVPEMTVIEPREVPLGGPRAMTVRRTLPARGRTMVGAWCFLDHYGPDPVAETGGMVVPPHPHTGLQTVSWLFTGQVEHRDSLGTHAMVEPGELNLMTAGHGVSHSEVSTEATRMLHGVQLWVALPEASRDGPPGFLHHVPEPVPVGRAQVSVLVGSLRAREGDGEVAGDWVETASPVPVHTPILGAEVCLPPGTGLEVATEPAFEHGVLLDTGHVLVAGEQLHEGSLGYLGPGRATLPLRAGEHGARVVLLGGEPFGEQLVMWWNFVGRSHEEVVAFRERWQAERDGTAEPTRFGRFDYPGDALPAPALPAVRLRPRG